MSYLSARVDTDTRTVRARLDVANPEGKLRPGMFVSVGFGGSSRRQQPRRTEHRAWWCRQAPWCARANNRWSLSPPASFVSSVGKSARGANPGVMSRSRATSAAGDEVVVEGAFLLKSAAAKASLGGGHSALRRRDHDQETRRCFSRPSFSGAGALVPGCGPGVFGSLQLCPSTPCPTSPMFKSRY